MTIESTTTNLGRLYAALPDHPYVAPDGTTYRHRVEPRHGKARVLVEGHVNPQNGTNVGGQHMPQGRFVAVLFREELDELTAHRRIASQEQMAAWRQCEADFAERLRKYIERETGKPDREPTDPEEAIMWHRKRRMLTEAFGETNVSKLFVERTGCDSGLPPLRDVRVIADVPATASEVDRVDAIQAAVQAQAASTASTNETLAALAAAIRELVAARADDSTKPRKAG